MKKCRSMPAARMHRDSAAEHRARQCRRDEHSREEQDVYAPRFPTLVRAPRKDEVTAFRLIGPVVSPGPFAEGGGQRRGGTGVHRIYKRINNFTVVKGGRPPRQQEPCEGHARPL